MLSFKRHKLDELGNYEDLTNVEPIKIDIFIEELLDIYSVNTDDFIMKLFEHLYDIFLSKYLRESICVKIFNEKIQYNNVYYGTFYDLYKVLNTRVIYSKNFAYKLDRLIKNLRPIKKGNRCISCLYPISYITNYKVYKICKICRRLTDIRKNLEQLTK